MGQVRMRIIFLAALVITNIAAFPAFSQTASGQVAVILVLDNSSSMDGNDPSGLRFTGTRLFASLLEPGDSAGVVLFSTQSNVLTDGLKVIQNEGDKPALLERLQDQSPDGYTDVKSAFFDVKELLRDADLTGRTAYVVFLTDGKPEIENAYPRYRWKPGPGQSLRVPVLAIALTSSAQTPFLDRLARGTGGQVIAADNAADLLDAY